MDEENLRDIRTRHDERTYDIDQNFDDMQVLIEEVERWFEAKDKLNHLVVNM